METNQITPVIDLKVIQEKANEAALKGALNSIEEFYNGYNSPYKKAIEESLKNKAVDNNFDIPDIVAVLNQKISQEIDLIANTAISKTFIPIVKKFLSREDAEIKFSDILEKFIEVSEFDHDENDIEDFTVEEISKHSSESLDKTFPCFQISNGKIGYELRFFKKDEETTTIMSLPYVLNDNQKYYREYERKETMKVSLDGVTLEMPFFKGVLDDNFVSYCARLVIGNNNIIFDTTEFSEEMFPERHDCHC